MALAAINTVQTSRGHGEQGRYRKIDMPARLPGGMACRKAGRKTVADAVGQEV